jgi:hypothetical protein
VGIGLMTEILDSRPASLGGHETVMLLAIAESASDVTRVGWPGRDLLATRGKCTHRTVQRRLAALETARLIEVVSRAQGHRRARYRILPMPVDNSEKGDIMLSAYVPVDNPSRETPTCPPKEPVDNKVGGQNGQSRRTALVSAVPSEDLVPSTDIGSVVTTSVEGSGLSTGQKRSSSAWTSPGYAICTECGGRELATALADGLCVWCVPVQEHA